MKFRIPFKTPDAMTEGIRSSLLQAGIPDAVDTDGNMDMRMHPTRDMVQTAEQFIQNGEFVVLEFDTETQTASVVPFRK